MLPAAQNGIDLLRGIVPEPLGDMAVSVQGETRRMMAKPLLHGTGVRAGK
jgi:hypothetical protein